MRLTNPLFRPVLFACLVAVVAVLGGCASLGPKADALHRTQYAWSGAIRWGDFEGAWGLLDPDMRDEKPMTDLEMERYKQVQISHYRDIGGMSDLDGGTAARDIEIGVINRHTLAERTVRYQETWRWDEEAKRWWVTSPMPDLWSGQ
ncbi:hypothetical protein [Marilutibacter maris]|uniref:Lipoprotein n=1 Tax=Marilutibacter maris TaxID=1605891 RepID=A0A2U9SZY3_9GAMM|nr:hypothetical protein [Lysobacter maris]AWV05896.1 hypothetical protein C9I47_0170 [Lysobacter maris]KAB8193395.1 hypothetical protein FKV24_006510 [Lysobacter maris]